MKEIKVIKFVVAYNFLLNNVVVQLKKAKPNNIDDRLKICKWIKDINVATQENLQKLEELKKDFESNRELYKDDQNKIQELIKIFDQDIQALGEQIIEIPDLDLSILPDEIKSNFTVEETMLLDDIYGQKTCE